MPVALIAVGGVMVWSGIENEPVTAIFRGLAAGKPPAKGTAETFATAASATASTTAGTAPAGDTGAHGGTAAANQAIAKVLAAPYGWSAGQEWASLVSLWNRESGWSNTIANASSGALGIAQALGHGTATSAGSLGNEYPSKAANDGNAAAQITWGLSYIKSAYGDPVAAWAHETSAGWY